MEIYLISDRCFSLIDHIHHLFKQVSSELKKDPE